MSDKPKTGWTEGALDAIVAWFPDLPRAVKVFFASATIYLVLCLVAQVSPVAMFEAGSNGLRGWVQENRAIAAQERQMAMSERQDLIGLLLEQNRELRKQAAGDPELEERVRILESKMDALIEGHPKARERLLSNYP